MNLNCYYPRKTPKEVRELMDEYEFSNPVSKGRTKNRTNNKKPGSSVQEYNSRVQLNDKSMDSRLSQRQYKRNWYANRKNLFHPKTASGTCLMNHSQPVNQSKITGNQRLKHKYAQAASYVLCKRAELMTTGSPEVDPVLQAMQDEIKTRYIKGLKTIRDRTILQDALWSAAKGGLHGSAIALFPGALTGAALAPVRDRQTDIPLGKSILRGTSVGTISGLLSGGVLGASAGVLGALLTRDARRNEAIRKLKALGVTG